MKTNYYKQLKTIMSGVWRFAPAFSKAALFAGLILSGSVATAQQQMNTLVNPDAETGSFSGWTEYGNAGYNFGTPTNNVIPHSGTYCFWLFGNYAGGANDIYSGYYQFVPAHPGQVFTADGWAYQTNTDAFPAGDGNNAFLEVTFQDINNATLARYRSATIDSNFTANTWVDLAVTNQYDPNTYAFIGTVTSLVAPAGTVRAEYNVVFDLHNYAGGSTYWDDLELLTTAPPPPYITNFAPTVIMATNNNMTFTAVAQSGAITNVQVTVVSSSGMVNPVVTTNVYDTNSLTISGLNTATANVSLPLATNTAYTVTILITDSNQGIATASQSFDTIRPVQVFEAEDFNFNSGQFIDTPSDGGTALYTNQVGSGNIDENKIGGPAANGGGAYHFYRPTDAVSIQAAGEVARQKFIDGIAAGNTNAIDEEVGYNSPGDWLDYTRTFPAGNYNIYARLATVGSGTMLNFGQVTSDPTQPNQTVTNLGTFSFTDNGWNTYQYVPLRDSFGNLVSVTLNGSPATFRSTVVGNPNINFYMLMPAVGSQNPALIQSYPTGLHPFEPTNTFSFTIGPAAGSAITSSDIHIILNGLDMTKLMTVTAGPTNTWNCSIPIAMNATYTAVINVTNTTSLSSKFTISFDTFSQNNFMWEAEDFDFNGGQFIDNPMPTGDDTLSGTGTSATANGSLAGNSYFGFPEGNPANAGIFGIDFTTVASADNGDLYYRPFENVGTELNFDYLRQKFLDARTTTGDQTVGDFDVGWLNGGWWLNYTRTYPTGQYYVYGRLAGGNGAFSGTTLSEVTSGWGTTTQTTQLLGSFADPGAAGWQTWHWVLMADTNNRPAIVTLGGTNTLKVTSGGNLNMNYFMLVPAISPLTLQATVSGSNPAVSFATQAGHIYTIVYKNNLTNPTWTVLTTVTGDGTVKTVPDTTGGSQRFYKVMVQ